jgi:hypothetical protein
MDQRRFEMKTTTSRLHVISWLAIFTIGGLLGIQNAHAADCKTPNGVAETRACEAAAKGPEELRHFVYRTRMIYGLNYQDFAPREESQRASAPQRGHTLAEGERAAR